jgi:hypothetical protein
MVRGAQDACDKVDDLSVDWPRWIGYVNSGLQSLFRKLAGQFADNWISSVDFTLASPTNSYALPSNFEQLRKLTRDPDLPARRTIKPFNLQESDSFRSDPSYRVMGRTIYLEPKDTAPGNYRAWYVPRPSLFHFDFTADVATTGALPACTAAGSGIGKTLTGNANGLLTMDSVDAVADQLWIIKNQANSVDNGMYIVSQAGDGTHPFILSRGSVSDGFAMRVTEGGQNIDQIYTVSLDGAVDVAPFLWVRQAVDDVMLPYVEYVHNYAAAQALEKESSDSSQQRGRCAEIEADLQVMAGAQEAGAQTAVADVEEFGDPRLRKHPLP